MTGTGKLLCTVTVMAGCILAGKGLAQGERKRVAFLEGALNGLRNMERDLRLRRMGVGRLLTDSGFAPFMEAGRIMERHNAAPAGAWAEADRESKRTALPDDLAALDRLFESLGEGDLEAQREYLAECGERLTERLTQARSKREQTGKLYPTLGALIGLALGIFLY